MFEDLFIVDEAFRRSEAEAKPKSAITTESNGNAHNLGKTGMMEEVEEEPPKLNLRKDPQYVRQQELPWHRIALEKAAKGYTAREIAEALGCSPTAVQDILRQPQYQQTQVNLIRRETDKDQEVLEIIKNNVVTAVKTLKEIMVDEKQSAAYRISAAKELLDRRYGKPNQPINRNTDVDLSQLSDADLIKALQN